MLRTMHLDAGVVAGYLSMLGGSFVVLAGMIYKFGKLMSRFDHAMSRIAEWEGAINNLRSIPDIKQGLEAQAEALSRHTSDISELRERMARFEGESRGRLQSLHDKDE
jgi:hypothetical protein